MMNNDEPSTPRLHSSSQPGLLDRLRRAARWTPTVALFVAAPKCVACVAAYLGIGAALGLRFGAPEICGATASMPAAWIASVAALSFLQIALFPNRRFAAFLLQHAKRAFARKTAATRCC